MSEWIPDIIWVHNEISRTFLEVWIWTCRIHLINQRFMLIYSLIETNIGQYFIHLEFGLTFTEHTCFREVIIHLKRQIMFSSWFNIDFLDKDTCWMCIRCHGEKWIPWYISMSLPTTWHVWGSVVWNIAIHSSICVFYDMFINTCMYVQQ